MAPENASSQPLKRSLTGNTVGRGRSASMQSVVETALPSKRQSTYPSGLSPPPSIVTVPALPLPNPAAMQATAGPGLSMNQSGDEEIISPTSTIDSRPRPASYSFTSRGAGAHPSAGIDRHRPESFESLATIKRPHKMN
ncbi:hypothetical protein FA10DRAFT_267807 [Acaromyces ingoldii]|uniref:Uncharacterized protein n=1 Tax=Acaromyces ingoldii TaxID=215250 RepID=A0A316YJ62_9BASI|nr:hypothetical protein FA10DRAFT_267807 [Acaromyces ingoldii]PWN89231.1 hypothetical protein FA10DRAFT_267807 [Acaromyces ingoldii]